eukprot:13844616-Alexandrium_andersonii.AAC.1
MTSSPSPAGARALSRRLLATSSRTSPSTPGPRTRSRNSRTREAQAAASRAPELRRRRPEGAAGPPPVSIEPRGRAPELNFQVNAG